MTPYVDRQVIKFGVVNVGDATSLTVIVDEAINFLDDHMASPAAMMEAFTDNHVNPEIVEEVPVSQKIVFFGNVFKNLLIIDYAPADTLLETIHDNRIHGKFQSRIVQIPVGSDQMISVLILVNEVELFILLCRSKTPRRYEE